MPRFTAKLLTFYLLPTGLILLNIALKLMYIDHRPIANDEPYSLYHAQMRIPDIIAELTTGNNPPLFEILLHYWIGLFGTQPAAARWLPLLFSSVTAAVVYLTGARLYKWPVGLAAALCYTFCTQQVLFAHETRAYPMLFLFTATSMLAFMQLVKQPGRPGQVLLLTLSNILLIYTHYLGAFIPVVQAACLFLFADIRHAIAKTLAISFGLTLVGCLPLLQVFMWRFGVTVAHGTWVQPTALSGLYNVVWSYSNMPVVAVLFIALLLFTGVKWAWQQMPYTRPYTRIVTVWLLLPLLTLFLLSYEKMPFTSPMFNIRYLGFVAIPFYLCIAIAAQNLLPGIKWPTAIPVLLMLATFSPKPTNSPRHVTELVNRVKQLQTPGTVIYLCPDYFALNFVYYYNYYYFTQHHTGNVYYKIDSLLATEHIYRLNSFTQIDTQQLAKAQRVLFIDAAANFAYPGNGIYPYLAQRLKQEEKYHFPEIFNLYVFKGNNNQP